MGGNTARIGAGLLLLVALIQPVGAGQLGQMTGGGTDYPGALDTASTKSDAQACDTTVATRNCAKMDNDLQAAIIAIETELGLNPSGSSATVVDRLNAIPAFSSATPTSTRYLKGSGTAWTTSSGAAAGAGACTNQVVTATNNDAAPTCSSLTNAMVAGAAAIAESKLSLNYATHSNANDPSAGEKAALVGTSGTPGSGNKYVTDSDSRNTNARTPTSHASSHQHSGGDEVATATPGANAIPKAGAGGTIDAGWVPTLNQNTTGTAANLSGTPALPNGVTATTQSQADNSTKVATTAYCDAGLATKLSLTGGTLAGPIDLADQHIKSGSDPADTGVMRYSNNEKLCWELATPGTDLCFYIGTDNEFHFDAPVNVGGSGGPLQLTEAAVSDPGSAGKAHIGVNTSHLLQWYGNGGSLRTAAFGTTTGVPIGDDTAYGAGWNGSTNTPTQNAVYDKIEALSSATGNLHACEYVGNVAAGATIYCSLTSYNASESWLTQVLAQSVTVTRFYLRTVGAQPGTGSLVVTLRKNGSDTSIVATIAAGTAGATVISDTAHSVAFSAGDTFSVKLVNNASASSADLSNIMLGW